MARPRKEHVENVETKEIKEPVEKIKESVIKSLSINIKNSFWCKELNTMIPRGVYKAKNSEEFEIVKKYLK